jgi:hypothetical protein
MNLQAKFSQKKDTKGRALQTLPCESSNDI